MSTLTEPEDESAQNLSARDVITLTRVNETYDGSSPRVRRPKVSLDNTSETHFQSIRRLCQCSDLVTRAGRDFPPMVLRGTRARNKLLIHLDRHRVSLASGNGVMYPDRHSHANEEEVNLWEVLFLF